MSESAGSSRSGSQANTKGVTKLVLITVGMFGFGWALIPLYDLLCEVTGLGGDPGGQYAYDPASERVDTSRLVKVNFIVNTNDGMPWQFWSDKGGMVTGDGTWKEVEDPEAAASARIDRILTFRN